MADDKQKKQKKVCFVVSPIGDANSDIRSHADWLLQGIIEPTFEAHFSEFSVQRADKISSPGMIDSQVINRLLDAEIVIADMSLQNANAFYEMGIRHMEQKPIIHMFKKGEKIPFDVAPYRAIPFDYSHPRDLVVAQKDLKDALEEVLSPEYKVENPVTRARGIVKIKEHATPENRLILEEMQNISARLNYIERNNISSNKNKFRNNIISSKNNSNNTLFADFKSRENWMDFINRSMNDGTLSHEDFKLATVESNGDKVIVKFTGEASYLRSLEDYIISNHMDLVNGVGTSLEY